MTWTCMRNYRQPVVGRTDRLLRVESERMSCIPGLGLIIPRTRHPGIGSKLCSSTRCHPRRFVRHGRSGLVGTSMFTNESDFRAPSLCSIPMLVFVVQRPRHRTMSVSFSDLQCVAFWTAKIHRRRMEDITVCRKAHFANAWRPYRTPACGEVFIRAPCQQKLGDFRMP